MYSPSDEEEGAIFQREKDLKQLHVLDGARRLITWLAVDVCCVAVLRVGLIRVDMPTCGRHLPSQVFVQRAQRLPLGFIVGEFEARGGDQCERHAHAEGSETNGVVLLEWPICAASMKG